MTGDLTSAVEVLQSLKQITECIPGAVGAVRDTFGMYVGDPIKAARQKRNLERTLQLTREIVRDRPLDENISRTVADEILHAAKNEDREELQKLWAALLARLATGKFDGIRIDFFEIIKKFEPIDAVTLSCFSKNKLVQNGYIGEEKYNKLISEIMLITKADSGDVNLSVEALVKLGCLRRGEGNNTLITQTLMGKKIFEAVQTD